jgi:hypothetical protein
MDVMGFKRIGTVVFGLITVFASSRPAAALNTTASEAHFMLLGEVQEDVLQAGALERWYKVALVAGRSYALYSWAPSTSPSDAPVNLSAAFFLDNGTTMAPGQVSGVLEPSVSVTLHVGANAAIIPTTSGTFRIKVSIPAIPANPITVHSLLLETTLFSPWYFKSAPNGYDAFVEIRNNTNAGVEVRVTAYNPAGAVVGTPQTVLLNGNGGTFVQISSFGVTDGQSGTAQIAHDGTPGAIAANITTLSAMTGLSFDSPFTPRMVWGSFR